MSKTIALQIKGPGIKPTRITLPDNATYGQLIDEIQPLFPAIDELTVQTGPPRPVEIKAERSELLSQCGIRSGMQLLVESADQDRVVIQGSGWDAPPTVDTRFGRMVHYKIPGDNSCLFHSIGVSLMRANPSKEMVLRLKKEIAAEITANPKKWGTAELGESPNSYIRQLNDPNCWGGAIETAIIAASYKCEVAVLDYYNMAVTIFGAQEGEQPFPRRVYVLYRGSPQGAHYDPIAYTSQAAKASALSGMSAGQAEQDVITSFDAKLQTIFSPRDPNALDMAKKIAELGHSQLVREGITPQRAWVMKDQKKKESQFTGASGAVVSQSPPPPQVKTTTITPSAQQPVRPTNPTPAPVSAPPQQQQQPKPKAPVAAPIKSTQDWSCVACTYVNTYSRTICEMCETPRPAGSTSPTPAPAPRPTPAPAPTPSTPAPAPSQAPASQNQPQQGPWQCQQCSTTNPESAQKCQSCRQKRPDGCCIM